MSIFPTNVKTIQTLLAEHPDAPLFPEVAQADPAAVRETPRGRELFEWAKTRPDEIPQLTYNLFREFQRTGDRDAFQEKNFARRRMLAQAALAAWMEPEEPAHVDCLNDVIWATCEETTWVLPAHEGPEWNIDLFNAETAAMLAEALLLLADRIPEEIHDRVYKEVDRRIFTNFLEHYWEERHFWYKGDGNWAGVCAGSVGETALMLEKDPVRQAKILSIALETLERYIDRGFTEDGGCLEGVGYWGYGLLHFVSLSKLLEARTGGKIDLLAHPKMERIARYPLAISLGGHMVASFADCGERATLPPCVSAPIAAKTGVTELLALTEGLQGDRLGSSLRNLLWWDGTKPEAVEPTDVFLPASGVCRMVGKASGKPIALIAKGGYNYEPHNHNDVGSFVLQANGTVYLCDPGSGRYTKAYFDERRYENLFTRSYGHSVPYIGGREQPLGPEYRASIEMIGEKTVRIDFTKAYDVKELASAVRTFTMNADGSVTMTDAFAFEGDGLDVQEAFMTREEVEIDGAVARIVAENGGGALELVADDGAFALEILEEDCKANGQARILKRISLTCPAAPKTARTFHMTYKTAG